MIVRYFRAAMLSMFANALAQSAAGDGNVSIIDFTKKKLTVQTL
jgi:hypothetical protein